ncbi:Uncharacterized protein LSUE1_G002521 [Lachnellula suecica]|uniref:Gfd2/YDR514C-like C-terminal domain-containing protein n=1 Tax=Lachnellula suecica TaxID=602035 RepID=A0A8T9C9X6_9HELO|nr:Uncharacterized protein LSUE1_G002521 [Lachnellula suecica]
MAQAEVSSEIDVLQSCLGLHSHCSWPYDYYKDVVFVSIDFENVRSVIHSFASQYMQCQLGVSIFDTRDYLAKPVKDALVTYNFSTGDNKKYHEQARSRFLFGVSKTITQQELASELEALIWRDRKIAIVGHGMACDFEILEFLGVDLEESVVAIFDTGDLVPLVLGCEGRSLGDLLEELGCPFDELHTAGNDANFTLRALIMMGIASHKDRYHYLDDDDRASVWKLWDIAHLPMERSSGTVEASEEECIRRVQLIDEYMLDVELSKQDYLAELAVERTIIDQRRQKCLARRKKWRDAKVRKGEKRGVRRNRTLEDQERLRTQRRMQRDNEKREMKAAGLWGLFDEEAALRQMRQDREDPFSGMWEGEFTFTTGFGEEMVKEESTQDDLFRGSSEKEVADLFPPLHRYLLPFPGFQSFLGQQCPRIKCMFDGGSARAAGTTVYVISQIIVLHRKIDYLA